MNWEYYAQLEDLMNDVDLTGRLFEWKGPGWYTVLPYNNQSRSKTDNLIDYVNRATNNVELALAELKRVQNEILDLL